MRSLGDPVDLSRDLLEAVRRGDPTGPVRARLAAYTGDGLAEALPDDARRRAFWLNLYNAAVQRSLADDPSAYDSRLRFFGGDRVSVAGRRLSLDRIEHGILRRSNLSFGFGYLRNPRPGAFERTHRVTELDPRIHFALNCGAASCPPIRSYDHSRLDEQLTLATESYLAATTDYDPGRGVVTVSRLFRWYRGDFGGRDGIGSFLRTHGAIPGDADPRLRYRPYDWRLDLGNFAGDA